MATKRSAKTVEAGHTVACNAGMYQTQCWIKQHYLLHEFLANLVTSRRDVLRCKTNPWVSCLILEWSAKGVVCAAKSQHPPLSMLLMQCTMDRKHLVRSEPYPPVHVTR